MAEVFNIADRLNISTKLVCSACGAPGEGSCRCGAPYVTPGERAEAAVKANPEKSDRAIAEDIGTDHKVVGRARKRTGAQAPVGKRKGKDGRTRRMPNPKRKMAKAEQETRAREIVHPLVVAGVTIDYVKLGKQHGISHVTIEKAARIERVLLHEPQVTVDIDTLSKSAKQKLETAKRVMERQLKAEYAKRVAGLNEEVRQRVLAEGKEYLAMMKGREAEANKTIAIYTEFLNKHAPLFTLDEFKTILMCLHPDGERTAGKLAEAFRLFNSKKFQLTKER